MTLEIEAKIKIESIDGLRDVLKENGAEYLGTHTQRDTYMNAPHRDFAKTDEALRIRDLDGKTEVTYKGPKIKGTGAKAREEYNMMTDSAEEMKALLEKLGYRESGGVRKVREEYSFMGAAIALDEVDELGSFAEIEVISDDSESALAKIQAVRDKLGIKGEHISTSYLEMILAKKGLN